MKIIKIELTLIKRTQHIYSKWIIKRIIRFICIIIQTIIYKIISYVNFTHNFRIVVEFLIILLRENFTLN